MASERNPEKTKTDIGKTLSYAITLKEIIKYQQSPIPIPHPDEAWTAMQALLQEAGPDAVPPTSSPATPAIVTKPARSFSSRIGLIILFLLIASLWPIDLRTPFANPPSLYSHSGVRSIAPIAGTLMASTSSVTRVHHVRTNYRHTPYKSTAPASASVSTNDLSDDTGQPEIASPSPANPYPKNAPVNSDSAATAVKKASPAETQIRQTDHLLLQLGLQWTAQIPAGNAGYYLTGINGGFRPWRILLPAAWMHLQLDKSLFEITLDPFYSNLVPARPFSQGTNTTTVSDTSITIHQSTTLDKLFGLSAGLGYAASLGGSWWAGGGIQTTWWTHAVATTRTDEVKQPLSNPTLDINSAFHNTAALSKTDWSNFSTFQLNVYAQLLYNKNSWHAGLRLGIPFTVLSKNAGPSSPFRMEFFYRLPLLSRQIRTVPLTDPE